MGHRILPDGCICPPCISLLVYGQAVALVHAAAGISGIFHIYHGAELTASAADKYTAQENLLSRSQQINPQVAASNVNLLYIYAEFALPIPGFQLGKPDILSLYLTFIGVDIRYQSPIIGHTFTPRTHNLQLP